MVEIKKGAALWGNDNWEKIGRLGEQIGFEWGGRWSKPDKPHFQLTLGYTTSDLNNMWESPGIPDYVSVVS